MNRQMVHKWYEAYKTGLFRFALSILKDESAAEDVLQEVFVRLLSGKYSPEPGKEQAYLYRCVRNLCYDEIRRRKRTTEEEREAADLRDPYRFLELIAPLGEKEREIITLKIVGGLTNREIGKVLGLTEQAVKKRYQRAIKKLREG